MRKSNKNFGTNACTALYPLIKLTNKHLNMKSIFILSSCLLAHFSFVFAQKPPVLTINGPVYSFSRSVADNFNAGRRFEETNKGLAVGTLGTLILPADFLTRPLALRALFLVNAERNCRNGVDYGTGILSVKPFQAVETSLSETAQSHANWLVAQNKLDHCGDPIYGTNCSAIYSSPSQRIQGRAKLTNGWERNSENIGLSMANTPNDVALVMANEKTIYEMLYRNGTNWVHRDNFLQTLTENYGDADNEGFLGVGERQAANFNPLSIPNSSQGKVLVYQIFDPKIDALNPFSFQTTALDSSKHYHIIAKHSGKALGISKALQTVGAAVIQSNLTDSTHQKWQIIPTTDGFYQLKAVHSGLVMDSRWGSAKQGTRLNQWTIQATSRSQEWQLLPAANGTYRIVNRHSSLNLSVPIYSLSDNMQLVQLNNAGYASQLWEIVAVD